jgi:hypothetical protein
MKKISDITLQYERTLELRSSLSRNHFSELDSSFVFLAGPKDFCSFNQNILERKPSKGHKILMIDSLKHTQSIYINLLKTGHQDILCTIKTFQFHSNPQTPTHKPTTFSTKFPYIINFIKSFNLHSSPYL